jgi:glycosyltransferase involved in cell wall biosynthesis
VLAAPYPRLDHFYFSPLKIFEYMAAGRPVVASSVGQVSDVLQHEATALLSAPGDAGALGDNLARLAADRELAAGLGAAARKVAVAEHTWRHRVRTIMDIMASLAARKGVHAS